MSSSIDDPWALARIMVTHDTDVGAFAHLLRGEQLRVAPQGEQWRTKAWRVVRRWQQQWRAGRKADEAAYATETPGA